MQYKDQTKYNFRIEFQQIQLLITNKQQQKTKSKTNGTFVTVKQQQQPI